MHPDAPLRPRPSALRGFMHRARIPLALAASAAMLAGLALILHDYGWTTYSTDFDKQQIVELSDGSSVHLNTQSKLRVHYGELTRDIELEQGEALFKVRPDRSRPFRVMSANTVVQAVGTQFNVRRRTELASVGVLEGSVRISQSPKGSNPLSVPATTAIEQLHQGQEAQIPERGDIRTRNVDVKQLATWRERRLVFADDTLADIAAEFNRYRRQPKIRIADEVAASRRFAATFDADAPEAFLLMVERNPDLQVERNSAEIIVRSRASSVPPRQQ